MDLHKVHFANGRAVVYDLQLAQAVGAKRWMFYYRFNGKQNTLGFGVYPDTALANARRKAEESRSNLANDINPSALRKLAKAEKQQIGEDQKRIDAGLPLINSFGYVTCECLASSI